MTDEFKFCFDNDTGVGASKAFVPASPNDSVFVCCAHNDGRVTTRYIRIVAWGVSEDGTALPVLSRPLEPNETYVLVEKGSVFSPVTGIELRDTQEFIAGIRHMVRDWPLNTETDGE